ncbi:MAG: hypothetical protein O3A20_01765 [Planctomycetota bacterium]|nr:hypothetical protein [Planctomycetota bacterium]
MLSALLALALTAPLAVQEPASAPASAKAEAEIADALTLAAKHNQRVLLMWGGDW